MLAPTFDYRQSLKLLRSEIETLNGRIAALLPAQWQQESHCPGWSVADLVMHVVRNGEAFLQFSQRMLADDDTPVCGFGYPDPREVALAGPEGAPRDVARKRKANGPQPERHKPKRFTPKGPGGRPNRDRPEGGRPRR